MIKKIKRFISNIKPSKVEPIIVKTSENVMLKDKVAFITGGSGGIGSAIAKKFIESGCKVIISGTNEIKLSKICDELGNNCKYIKIDLSDIDNIKKSIKEAIKLFGRIDIFVSSHGIHTTRKINSFIDFNEKDYDDIMNINLKSTYFLCKEIAYYFINNKIKGHILLISSSTSEEPAWSPYRLSKNSINSLVKGMAQSLINDDIVVNGIAPGPTATSLLNYSEGQSIYTEDNCIYRYTMPEEIAEYAVLLASNLGNTIVGDIIFMSGGRGTIDIR